MGTVLHRLRNGLSFSPSPISRPLRPLLHRTLASIAPPELTTPVAIFWDLDNKPPNSIPPYDAASRLRLAASAFGSVLYTVAYANPHAFRHVPAPVRAARSDRAALDRLEDAGAAAPSEPYVCRVCGRNFYHRSKLLDHFKQLHEREQAKRLRRLGSARGSRRADLAAQLSAKIEKYKRAAGDLLVPKSGYGLAEELRRAGVRVREVEDRREAADRALREHMVEEMDRGRMGCLVLVSDDAGFVPVLREARARCVKTVVVGDEGDGALKRCADAGFSWKEVVSGKARKEAASAVGKWRDRELLKRLEWTYQPGDEESDLDDGFEDESEEGDDVVGGLGMLARRGDGPWWELESGSNESHSGSQSGNFSGRLVSFVAMLLSFHSYPLLAYGACGLKKWS